MNERRGSDVFDDLGAQLRQQADTDFTGDTMSSTTFAGDFENMIRHALRGSIETITEEVKKKAHAELEEELNKAISRIAVELASEISIVDREHQIVLTVRKP